MDLLPPIHHLNQPLLRVKETRRRIKISKMLVPSLTSFWMVQSVTKVTIVEYLHRFPAFLSPSPVTAHFHSLLSLLFLQPSSHVELSVKALFYTGADKAMHLSYSSHYSILFRAPLIVSRLLRRLQRKRFDITSGETSFFERKTRVVTVFLAHPVLPLIQPITNKIFVLLISWYIKCFFSSITVEEYKNVMRAVVRECYKKKILDGDKVKEKVKEYVRAVKSGEQLDVGHHSSKRAESSEEKSAVPIKRQKVDV
ncbi:hypothetical protein Y032_0006g2971 [Ancylostoma ceylanicum]|uniref:Uncharacterized protein n=1 Tax=Ancylostoma ceylanicum TaxID=53326 RepID=A0A016VQ35_9BILA|nr:hypothetical protein Y032_0006g2971 [Ancylostoma ceylanicum]